MWRIIIPLLLLFILVTCESVDRPDLDNSITGGDIDRPDSSLREQATAGGPYIEITIPVYNGLNPALMPPVSTFEWRTIQGSVDPDSVRWILLPRIYDDIDWSQTLNYIRENPDAPEWAPWQVYDPANGINTSWTTPPMGFGNYLFAIHGKEADSTAAQDFDEERNVRRVLISRRSTGPLVTLTSAFLDPIMSVVPTTPFTVVELPAGTPVTFCWTGDAHNYGGVVRSYRCGWDIPDLEDDTQWDVDITPSDGSEECSATRTFFFGTHTFYVEVYDNCDYFTRIPVKINFTPPPLVVSLDIQPDLCPNKIKPWGNGSLWVALLGSADLNIIDVDISTVTLNEIDFDAEGIQPGQYKIEDVTGTPDDGEECNHPLISPDGYDDLTVKFGLNDVGTLIGTAEMGEMRRFVLTGLLLDGTPFMAQDSVLIGGIDFEDVPGPEDRGPTTNIFQIVNTYWVDGQPFAQVIDFRDAIPDTVPFGSWITFFYRGSPGRLNMSYCNDDTNKCLAYQKNFTWSSARYPGVGGTTNWLPVQPEDTNLFGVTDSTSMNVGSAEYIIRVRSVDELGRFDTTPAEFAIAGNLKPSLDEFGIRDHDGTLVEDGDTLVWDWWNPANFHGNSSDTLDLSDPPNVWIDREFYFVITGSGHDHPKEGSGAGIKSWFYGFTRSEDPSYNQPFAQSGAWVDAATINAVSDTVRLHVRYNLIDDVGGVIAFNNLPDWVHQSYEFSIRGRDTKSTDESDQLMFANRELHQINSYNTSALGLETRIGSSTFYLTVVR